MIKVPEGKTLDWYDGYAYGLNQARQIIQDAGDDVWDAILDTPEVRDEGLEDD